MRMMGHKPMRLNPFREYIQVVRALLQGEEVEYTLDGETHPIQFQMREQRSQVAEHLLRHAVLHMPLQPDESDGVAPASYGHPYRYACRS
jgi:hypothetical protein